MQETAKATALRVPHFPEDHLVGKKNSRQPNGALEGFPSELVDKARAALEAEQQSLDQGIDAWKKLVTTAPAEWAPRRELARAYKKAEKWKAYVDAMREGVDKATFRSPEAKIPVLLEMIEVYRDQLKQDVMVIHAFNQILTIQPDNLTVVDALAATYEQMGRWPELISILRKKVSVLSAADEKATVHLRVANLYLEKFSNQAEAIKAFEAVLELDSSNQDALTYLRQLYEKRRDWDKLVALSRNELGRMQDAELRRSKRIEVARLASEKLKKPLVSIELWRDVLSDAADNAEALAELEKLYEREKQWSELALVLEKQAVILPQDKRASVLLKLALLYPDKINDVGKAVAAWQQVMAADPDNRRAQDALRKLYLQQKDWDALEGFYAGQSKWDEFVRVLERQAESEEGAARVSLANKIGQLYRDRLNKVDRAQKAFERALSLDGQDLTAALALIPLYERTNDAKRLAVVLGVQLGHATDPVARQEQNQRLARLLDEQVGDKVGAMAVALKAFSENPLVDWTRQMAERLADEVGDWASLAKAYEGAVASVEGARAMPILTTLARAYEQHLAAADTAIATNQKILGLEADDADALQALERLYVATGRHAELLAIYDKKLALAKGDAAKREVRLRLGGLYEREVKDADQAIAIYKDVLKANAKDADALLALERLYRANGKWKEVVGTIEKLLELEPAKALAADLTFRLAEVRQGHMNDVDAAVLGFAEALSLDATHAGARAALEGYLADDDRQLSAVTALDPIYEVAGDLVRLIETHQIRLRGEKDSDRRMALLLRMAGFEREVGRADAAFDVFAQAFKEGPASMEARHALEELAATGDKWAELVDLYTAALKEKGKQKVEPGIERHLLLVVAEAYDAKLGQSDKAVEFFRRAQELEPDDTSVLEALERLYMRNERWPELVTTLKKKVEFVRESSEREQIRARIATVWEEAIGSADEAIGAWKEVLAENPANLSALRALDRLYVGKGMDAELAENLQRQLDLVEGHDDLVNVLGRLGRCKADRLGLVAGAVEIYRRLLDVAPGHVETVEALQRLLPSPEHEGAVAELLEPAYRARGDFAALVRVLEIAVKTAATPERKLALLREIATSYEDGCDDPGRAYEALGRALAESPLDPDSAKSIDRLGHVLGRVDELCGTYERLAEASNDDAIKHRLFARAATLAETELGQDERAVTAYERALQASPRDQESAAALERIYLRSSDYARLVVLLERKMVALDDRAAKKELGLRTAQIYEEVLAAPQKAIEVYRQVLELDEGDRATLEYLERLYVRLSRWNDLKDIYAKKADLAATPEQKKEVLSVLGQVYERQLNDPAHAIETYSAILDLDPNDFEAVQALDRLYVQTERWHDLLTVLERQTELSPSVAEIVSLRFRIGDLLRGKLRDFVRAAEAFKHVLDVEPTHEPTLRALGAMMAAGEEPILAAQVLEPIYESVGEWDAVAGTYEVMVKHTDDSVRKVELLGKIAHIHERRLINPNAAFDAWCRALRIDPTSPDAVAQLDRLAASSGRWADLATAYQEELDRVLDSRIQVEMLLRIARIYEEETGEVGQAIAAYKRVCEVEPDRKEGLLALDRLYTKAQAWPDLAEILRRQIRLADNDRDIVAFSFRLAQLLELVIGDAAKAVETYQEILNADPAHAETRAALERLLHGGTMAAEIGNLLEPLYRLSEDWEKLAEVYRVLLPLKTDPEERLGLLRRLADIAESKLLDQVAAFEWWSRALLEDPASEQANEESLRLARLTHQWEGYTAALLGAAGKAATPSVRRDLLLRLAGVFEQELMDMLRAEEVLGQVLVENPEDAAALEFLDRVYERQGMYAELGPVLRRRIRVTDDSQALVALQLRLGRVLAEVLDDGEGAAAAYAAVLEQESRCPEALEALERLHFRSERWRDLYDVYEKMVDIAPGDQALSDCYARMARITSEVFGDRAKAVELWAKVKDLRGTDPVALAALADLHEQGGEWRELCEILDNQIQATADPVQRIAITKRLGRIWGEKLSRERNALECWQRVIELDPGDIEALRAIAENHRSAGAWEDLSESIGKLIERGAGTMVPDELKDLYIQWGELEGGTLMRTEPAISAWRHVIELDDKDLRALAALETLYMQEARFEECVDVLERRRRVVASPEEQIDVLLQIASLWADKVGDGGAAAEAYERVLQIEPGHATAAKEALELYRLRKDWMKLVELLLSRTEFVGEAVERIGLLCQVAEIYEQQLDDRDSAFVTLQAAFREDYSNDKVAKELERLATLADKWNELLSDFTSVVQTISDPRQAADLWVKIGRWYDSVLQHVDYAIASVQQALALDPNHPGALGAMEDFYRKKGDWRDLVGVLARHADVVTTPEDKVPRLLALAEAYETQLGDVAQATLAYQRALDTDERCLEAIDALERLYRRTQAWDRLVGVLDKKAQTIDDGELSVKLRLQAGEIWEERLGDNDRAVAAFKDVLTADPQSQDALKALGRLYQKTGKMDAYLDVLEREIEVASSEAVRALLYRQMASVWEEKFGKIDKAIDCLQKVLLIDNRDLPTYQSLGRLYEAERKWDALVENIRGHILVADDPSERTDLYFRMGKVYEDEIKNPDRAIESYNDVVTFDLEHVEALRGLSRLFEQTEQWADAVEIMQRLIPLVGPKEKVGLYHRLGKLFDEQLHNPEMAEERLGDALGLDPTHVPSMLALLSLYRQRGDSMKAAQIMVRAVEHTQNTLEKTRLLFDAGKILQTEIGDENGALELFSRVLELDPEHALAAEPLAEIYFQQGAWAKLAPILEMLVRKADRKAKGALAVLYYRMGKVHAELGEVDRALKDYKQSYDLDPAHLPTLLERAALLYQRELWDDAFKLYQTVLVHHREAQQERDVVEIFYRIGQIKLRMGEKVKAINMFEKALELDSGHRLTLDALVESHSNAGDWEAVIRQKRAILNHSSNDDEKIAVHQQIIEIYKNRLQNPQKAIAAYLEALEVRPNDRGLLHDVLDLFTETKQWKRAVEVLTRLGSLEQGPAKARYLDAAGNITHYELHAPDEAVELYNEALDSDPTLLKVFERVDKILTSKKDWKAQERQYRKMIKRLGPTPDPELKQTQVALWHALGEIYRSRLKNFASAAEAFEVCVNLEPENFQRHVILAELHQMAGPASYEKAVREHRYIIGKATDLSQVTEPLRILRKLYHELHQYDRAWCVTAALAFLRKADAEEQRFFEQYRPKGGMARARARLTEELWQKNIFHPDEDRYVSAVLAVVSRSVAAVRAREHKDWGIKRKDKRDPATDQLMFSKVFGYVAQILGLAEPPELFLRQDWAGDLEMANAREKAQLTPAFIVGSSLLQGRQEKELVYIVAKKLTLMRPDHFVRWQHVVPTVAELKVLFLAAVKLVQPNLPIQGELAAPVAQYVEALRRSIPPQHVEQLSVVVQRFIATKAEADLHKWSDAVDYTATRVGYLMCGDLEVAARMVSAEPVTVGSVDPKDKIMDLVRWTISDEYFGVREQLGLTIG